MPEIIIAVQNKLPILAGAVQHIVADNSDYTIRFLFDDQWDEGEKTVYFVRSNGYAYPPVKTVDGVVQVPVQTDVNLMSQLLVGVRQGEVKTSRPCGIAVYPAISNVIKDDAVQPDESLWEQVIDRLDELEKNGGGGSGSGGGIYIGPEETMPKGTKVRIDPNGKRVEIPQIDDTLTKQGYAADAAAVGDALSKKLGADKLGAAVDDALRQAKESGEFDGEDGKPGDDYVLTDADKAEIAQIAVDLLPKYNGEVEDV